ncbi:MAG: hypothetical protein SFY80_10205 [Verrucomicrobiota bacterium]|nr:hypothetical protein [Verrucomicrobiota bacterium]
MKILTLSIRQPWAGWLFNQPPFPRKDIENRTWSTKYRGWLAIHASKTRDDDNAACFLDFVNDRLEPPFNLVNGGHDFVDLPQCTITGAIIGFIHLDAIGKGHASPWAMPRQHHWQFSQPHLLKLPIPVPGAMCLYYTTIHDDLIPEPIITDLLQLPPIPHFPVMDLRNLPSAICPLQS